MRQYDEWEAEHTDRERTGIRGINKAGKRDKDREEARRRGPFWPLFTPPSLPSLSSLLFFWPLLSPLVSHPFLASFFFSWPLLSPSASPPSTASRPFPASCFFLASTLVPGLPPLCSLPPLSGLLFFLASTLAPGLPPLCSLPPLSSLLFF